MSRIDNSIFDGPKTVHVYSTLANSQQYPVYERDPQGNALILAYVHINGGAGVANKRLDTPVGVLTSISDRALAHLLECHTFKEHVKRGHITYRTDQVDIERAVAEHTSERDQSAPITPEHYIEEAEEAARNDEAIVAVPEKMKASKRR